MLLLNVDSLFKGDVFERGVFEQALTRFAGMSSAQC
jgi:hypothetical protein